MRASPEDWRAWRDLRLEALQDTPIGFARSYEETVGWTEEQWQELLSRPGGWWLVPGRAMAAAYEDDGRCWFISVYVAPASRGRGLLDRLVEAASAWAREHGHDELVLEVHEDNARAQAAYARLGFAATGERRPYPLDPSRDELVMVLPV